MNARVSTSTTILASILAIAIIAILCFAAYTTHGMGGFRHSWLQHSFRK
jgi:hypothetical protein